ncbi:MAG: prepilin-type N-terminal cleavage/methylation domain-containing protein [Chthoniobacterales bacterium]
MSAHRQRGFTIIELLVAITIIGILAALTAGIAVYVMDVDHRHLAKSQIETLTTLIETYKLDQGAYPEQGNGDAGNSTAALIAALSPTRPDAKIYPIPVRMFDSYRAGLDEDTIRASAHYLVDPFGRPYHYQYTGAINRNGETCYDLWSRGSKDSADPKLWIKNW